MFNQKPTCKGIVKSFCALSIFASATVSIPVSHAAEQVGQSVKIRNQVNGSVQNRQLSPADPVFASERISAAINSHGELRLTDNSRVLVGENSVVALDDFVVAGNKFDKGSVRVAKGALRFISGNSPKGTYQITTPVSTIGVRGTTFDVYVKPNGNTRVILFQGQVEVCSSGNCETINRPCDVVDVEPGVARKFDYLRSGDREEEDQEYDLTNRQNRFQPGWRAPVFICETRAALDPNNRRLRLPRQNQEFPDPGPDNRGAQAKPDPEPEYDPCGGPYGC